MVGLASGLVLGNLGYTHCCIEDIGVLRSIPNINIISPSDSLETIKAVEASLISKNSCYIRLTGGSNNPIINKTDYNFKIGKSITLKEGKDIVIFSSGSILNETLMAARSLQNEGISTKVVNMHTIKPIDENVIKNAIQNFKLIVSVEEHNIIGGLGSAVSETLSKFKNSPPQLTIGINDTYSKSGSYDFLKNYHGLTHKKILMNIIKKLND